MNWSGFETTEAVPGGLDSQDYRAILNTIRQSGFNTVRIPFSNQMVETPAVPERLRFKGASGPMNTDLRDLNSLEILDRLIAYAGEIGLKVILDNHRSEAGSSAEASGLWYTQQFPESAWIKDWTALALRYGDNPAVIGMDLRNEPHNASRGGACWDCGGPNDWHRAAQRAGDAILSVNPNLLIFVEGVDSYAGDAYWWGGNLEGVHRSPVHLAVPNRLVYSAHEYGPVEYAQPWFNESTSPATLTSVWRQHWAFISEAGIAPVWIGEFGTPNEPGDVESSISGSEGQWFNSLVAFLGGHPNLGWTYWGVNGEDRYGLLGRTYSAQPANQMKAEALLSITAGTSAQRGLVLTNASKPQTRPTFDPNLFQVPTFSAGKTTQTSSAQTVEDSVPQPAQLSSKRSSTSRRARGSSGMEIASKASVQRSIKLSIREATSKADQTLSLASE